MYRRRGKAISFAPKFTNAKINKMDKFIYAFKQAKFCKSYLCWCDGINSFTFLNKCRKCTVIIDFHKKSK